MAELAHYVVAPSDTIQRAMETIDRNGMRAVIVVDEGKVVGTVSDGDIRRALLHNVIMMSPVGGIMQLNPRVTTSSAAPQDREDLIAKHNLTLLPVVDDENRLVDVQLAYEPF
jgi:CBS domain-containing protein